MVSELLCRYCGRGLSRDYSAVYPKPANTGWETQFLPRLKPGDSLLQLFEGVGKRIARVREVLGYPKATIG